MTSEFTDELKAKLRERQLFNHSPITESHEPIYGFDHHFGTIWLKCESNSHELIAMLKKIVEEC